MKKIIYSIVASLLFGLGSCDSLDLSPIDYAATGNYWKNASEVETYMNGLHSQLRSDYFSPIILGELRGGAMMSGTSSINTSLNYSSVIDNALRISSTGVNNWNGYYSNILQLNHFIDKVTNECKFLTGEERNLFLAQAYGIRAYYYFMLYRTYGAVPLEKDVKLMEGSIDLVALYMARSSAEDVLKFIKDEIAASEQAFGASTTLNRYKWSRYATLFLKAQVYLWSGKVTTNDYEQAHQKTGSADIEVAKKALDDLIGSGQFELEKNFSDIFAHTKKKNKEIILSFPFERNEITNSGSAFLYTPSIVVGSYFDKNGEVMKDVLELGTVGIVRYEWKESFVKSMDEADTRRAATFLEYYSNKELTDFGSSMVKYIGHMDGGIRYFDSDIVLFRYADVLLMRAEVENALSGKCAAYLNQIRQRAYGENYTEKEAYADGTFAENELAILKERDKEFVAEGCRWFDVIRMHDASGNPLVFSAEAAYGKKGVEVAPILDRATELYKLLWPISVTMQTDDPELKQTWGYEEAEAKK